MLACGVVADVKVGVGDERGEGGEGAAEEAELSQQPARGRQEKLVYKPKGAPAEESTQEAAEESKPLRSKIKPQLVYKKKGEISAKDEDTQEGEEGAPSKQKEGGRKQQQKDKRRKEPEEIPKFTSAYHEYQAGYWRLPRKDKIIVKLDTELPKIPTVLLEAPDEATYHKA